MDKEFHGLSGDDKADWANQDVLVGVLHNARQLEANLSHLFYHIPAKLLGKKPESIRYVALYQSIRQFGSAAGVRYYGRVLQCRLLRRDAIAEIPAGRHGDELYIRFDVACWETLDRPIRARGVGPGVYLRTNYFLLRHCRSVPELFIRSPAEWAVYVRLRRAAARTRHGGAEQIAGKGSSRVLVSGPAIGVYTAGQYLHFDLRDFYTRPHDFMQSLMDYVQNSG